MKRIKLLSLCLLTLMSCTNTNTDNFQTITKSEYQNIVSKLQDKTYLSARIINSDSSYIEFTYNTKSKSFEINNKTELEENKKTTLTTLLNDYTMSKVSLDYTYVKYEKFTYNKEKFYKLSTVKSHTTGYYIKSMTFNEYGYLTSFNDIDGVDGEKQSKEEGNIDLKFSVIYEYESGEYTSQLTEEEIKTEILSVDLKDGD